LHISVLFSVGMIGIVYIICRILGMTGGSFLAAWVIKANKKVRNYLGLSILSQAGVAIGLALLASNYLSSLGHPNLGTTIVTIVTATTVVFEIIGPILARFSITQAGEARNA
jgi:Kef-type K+ transport system membrane component KefB